MKLLEDLLDSLDEDAVVRHLLVGLRWTVVCSRFCGMAATYTSKHPHGAAPDIGIGQLHRRSARELAEMARSDDLLSASIGVAALNSLLPVSHRATDEINAADVLIECGRGKNIAMVGHFPFIPRIQPIADRLWVIELEPGPGEYPAEAAPDLIPQADVVAITGSALINHTLENLLGYCTPGATVMVLGPTTPLSPILFDYGATLLSGAYIIEEEAVLRTVSQGANFRQVEGVRLLTISRDKYDLINRNHQTDPYPD